MVIAYIALEVSWTPLTNNSKAGFSCLLGFLIDKLLFWALFTPNGLTSFKLGIYVCTCTYLLCMYLKHIIYVFKHKILHFPVAFQWFWVFFISLSILSLSIPTLLPPQVKFFYPLPISKTSFEMQGLPWFCSRFSAVYTDSKNSPVMAFTNFVLFVPRLPVFSESW